MRGMIIRGARCRLKRHNSDGEDAYAFTIRTHGGEYQWLANQIKSMLNPIQDCKYDKRLQAKPAEYIEDIYRFTRKSGDCKTQSEWRFREYLDQITNYLKHTEKETA